ncbi:MAG: PspC domain-containing protein [Flavobacteriales bacterium]|jgi:phage shock protein C|nr:PspC domain-containing protein [Flavobacteriales bacterium]
MKKKLYRNTKEGMIFGVCAGLGDYLNIDAAFIRIIWLLTVICYGTGLLAYLLAALLIIPAKSE